MARRVHLYRTVRRFAVSGTPLRASGEARCRKGKTVFALGGVGGSRGRCRQGDLVQEFRIPQHGEPVGER